MSPLVHSAPLILAALIVMATLFQWAMRARGLKVRQFGALSNAWRLVVLNEAAKQLETL